MSGPGLILIGLQGTLFLVWAILMFRWLFGLRRRAVALSGQPWPGPRAQIGALVNWWRDPAAAAERRWLAAFTLALFAATALSAALSAVLFAARVG